MNEMVESWRVEQGVGVLVNDQPLPCKVHIDGPMVEAIDEYHHILWMPLLAKGPAPRAGQPNGEPAEEMRGHR